MNAITINIDQTPEALTKLAKGVRQLAQQQRYHNDESCMVSCADILDKLVLELPPEPVEEHPAEPSGEEIIRTPEQKEAHKVYRASLNCSICGEPSEGGPHQACIDKLVDNDDGGDTYAQVQADDYGSGGDTE